MRLLYTLTVLCSGMLATAATAGAATFTVNTTGDAGDLTCDATCTLRDAIDDANASDLEVDEIAFSAAMTIVPTSELPPISTPTLINGRQGPGCVATDPPRLVQIDGNGGLYTGLTLAAGSDGSRICTLNIRNFGGDGIHIASSFNTIDGSRIGTDITGEIDDGNDSAGIVVDGADGGDGNTIGGTTPETRNVISGNADSGVALLGSATGNTISGNYVGTDKDGVTAIPNQTGISVPSTAASTIVGGTAPGAGNLIAGNTGPGADVAAGVVQGNLIGTNAAGGAAIGNGNGLNVSGAIVVGGTAQEARNVISGNDDIGLFVNGPATIQGNYVGTNVAGTAALSVAQDFGVSVRDGGDDAVIGGTAAGAGNVISGNVTALETILAVDDVTIQGNTIGLTADGSAVVPNNTGIKLGSSTTDTQIGGTTPGARNLIGGHTAAVPFGAAVDVGAADGTIIEGNTLGLLADGTAAPNDRGVAVGNGGNLTRIGGTAAGAGNVIAGNTDFGVNLGQDSTNSTVQGNLIGLGADGATARPNGTGIRLDKSSAALIGGTAAGARNVISGNVAAGITIAGGQTVAPVIQGNTIGLAADDTTDVGNGQSGITLGAVTDAQIGGTSAAARNVIAGNGFDGIQIQSGVEDAAIQGNRIGVAADGVTARPNDQAGVEFSTTGGTTATTLGGTAAGAGNVIASNGEDGVRVVGGSVGAAILGNSIRANGAASATDIGIDLGTSLSPFDGVTLNDPGDGDGATDPNHLQNFPLLTSAVTTGTTTTVGGTIDTLPGRSIRIELFSSGTCDAAGHGQGEVFLGATNVTSGSAPTAFSAAVAGTPAGRQITATATDLGVTETSEFSACRTATAAPVTPPVTTTTPPATTTTTVVTPAGPAVSTRPPKYPAKIRVLRNGVDDGVLDMLIEITARAKTPGAVLALAYESSGRTTRFTVPITGTQIKVRKRLPSSQPKDTGITTVTYAGNDLVDPDEVRLRAADGKSELVRSSSTIRSGRLLVDGTVSERARGVVRVRMSYAKPDGSTGLLDFRAPIDDGRWSLNGALPAEAAAGGQLSIQFTGYEAANLRGEQTAKQVP